MTDSDVLRRHVRSRLPENVLALLDELESFAGKALTFAFNDMPAPDNYPDAAACRISEKDACILLREGAAINPQDVLHELLHVRRYWIERIPQLEPIAELEHLGGNWDVTSRIENTLEHLVIVPQEAKYGFGPRQIWDEGALNEWAGYPWPDLKDTFSRRLGWVLAWLGTSLLTDAAVGRLAEQCLMSEGVLGEAMRIRSAVAKRLPDKGRCLLTVTKAVGIARKEVRLVYLDAKTKQRTYAPLPFA